MQVFVKDRIWVGMSEKVLRPSALHAEVRDLLALKPEVRNKLTVET